MLVIFENLQIPLLVLSLLLANKFRFTSHLIALSNALSQNYNINAGLHIILILVVNVFEILLENRIRESDSASIIFFIFLMIISH